MSFDTFTHALEVVALVMLFSFTFAMAIGTYLRERERDYRLSYESEYPKSNVRVIREGTDV